MKTLDITSDIKNANTLQAIEISLFACAPGTYSKQYVKRYTVVIIITRSN